MSSHTTSSVGHRKATNFRPEIQALRAFAVGVVVVYHFWPHLLPGGFVGVDIFFAISGFLITAHLLSEWERRGRISIPRFWARRLRRLLPASLVVIGASVVGTLLFIPQMHWQQYLKEAAASALYVQNWVLANDSVDYLAAENTASPIQHFWTLSVEEQFYFAWPLLLVAALLLTRRPSPVGRRRAMLLTLVVVFVASLVTSIVLTASDPGPAYFSTFTRAWEFAAGGLLAFTVPLMARLHGVARAVIAWAGWAATLASVLIIDSQTPFPGIAAALPVVAALAVIAAGRAPVAWAPDRLVTLRPFVALGDVSYSVYLWHWPILIFATYALGDGLRWWIKLLVIAGVIVLAWLTTRFIEDPVRRAPPLVRSRPRATFVAAAVAMSLVVIPSAGGWAGLRSSAAADLRAAEELAQKEDACIGAATRDPELDCSGVEHATLIPEPSSAVDDKAESYELKCITRDAESTIVSCPLGLDGDGERVAWIGDSHLVHWEPALTRIATERDWAVTTYYKSSCPLTTADNQFKERERYLSCRQWNADMVGELADQPAFDTVVVSQFAFAEYYASRDEAVAGYREAWQRLIDRGSRVVVLRDIPTVTEATPTCVAETAPDTSGCDLPAREALWPDSMVEAAEGMSGVAVIDLTDSFCWDGVCHVVVGGVVVYRDSHHMTRTFALTLAPQLDRELGRLGI